VPLLPAGPLEPKRRPPHSSHRLFRVAAVRECFGPSSAYESRYLPAQQEHSYLYQYGLLQRPVRPTRQRSSVPSAAVPARRCALPNIDHDLSFAPIALTEPQSGCYCCRGSRKSTTPLHHECAAYLIAHRSAETSGCRSRHDCEPISHIFPSRKRRIHLYPAAEL
jgi:hypothetical protein